jgi:GxxExxY protein
MQNIELTSEIIGCAIQVHNKLGPGLLESAYQTCLHYELCKFGFKVEREKSLAIQYGQVKIDCAYRMDFVVENKVILEIKAVNTFHDIHLAQMLTYLRLSKLKTGLLINFNVEKLQYGIKRVANGY